MKFLFNTNAIGGRENAGGTLERVHGGVDGFHHVGDRVRPGKGHLSVDLNKVKSLKYKKCIP